VGDNRKDGPAAAKETKPSCKPAGILLLSVMMEVGCGASE
jgi:hypothetical protein